MSKQGTEQQKRGGNEFAKIALIEAKVNAAQRHINELAKEWEELDKTWESWTPEQQTQIALSDEHLEGLPWRDYQSGKGACIYSSESPMLLEALKTSQKGRLTLGDYDYVLGRDPRFIARFHRRQNPQKPAGKEAMTSARTAEAKH